MDVEVSAGEEPERELDERLDRAKPAVMSATSDRTQEERTSSLHCIRTLSELCESEMSCSHSRNVRLGVVLELVVAVVRLQLSICRHCRQLIAKLLCRSPIAKATA